MSEQQRQRQRQQQTSKPKATGNRKAATIVLARANSAILKSRSTWNPCVPTTGPGMQGVSISAPDHRRPPPSCNDTKQKAKTKRSRRKNVAAKETISAEQEESRFNLRDKLTSVQGQLEVNPHFTVQEAKLAAKKEYTKRSGARARQRGKFRLQELQQTYAGLQERSVALEEENAILSLNIERLKRELSDKDEMPQQLKQDHDNRGSEIYKEAEADLKPSSLRPELKETRSPSAHAITSTSSNHNSSESSFVREGNTSASQSDGMHQISLPTQSFRFPLASSHTQQPPIQAYPPAPPPAMPVPRIEPLLHTHFPNSGPQQAFLQSKQTSPAQSNLATLSQNRAKAPLGGNSSLQETNFSTSAPLQAFIGNKQSGPPQSNVATMLQQILDQNKARAPLGGNGSLQDMDLSNSAPQQAFIENKQSSPLQSNVTTMLQQILEQNKVDATSGGNSTLQSLPTQPLLNQVNMPIAGLLPQLQRQQDTLLSQQQQLPSDTHQHCMPGQLSAFSDPSLSDEEKVSQLQEALLALVGQSESSPSSAHYRQTPPG